MRKISRACVCVRACVVDRRIKTRPGRESSRSHIVGPNCFGLSVNWKLILVDRRNCGATLGSCQWYTTRGGGAYIWRRVPECSTSAGETCADLWKTKGESKRRAREYKRAWGLLWETRVCVLLVTLQTHSRHMCAGGLSSPRPPPREGPIIAGRNSRASRLGIQSPCVVCPVMPNATLYDTVYILVFDALSLSAFISLLLSRFHARKS